MKNISIYSCFLLLLCSGILSAQVTELSEPYFSLSIQVLDKKDPQIITWNHYLLSKVPSKDQQGSLRLYPDQPYHLKFLFAYQHKGGEINHTNFRTKKYRVEIEPSDPAKFKINAMSTTGDPEGISVHGLCLAKSSEPVTFNFQLIDAQGQRLINDALPSIVLAKELVDPSYFHEQFLKYRLGEEMLLPLEKGELLKLEKEQQKLYKGGNN